MAEDGDESGFKPSRKLLRALITVSEEIRAEDAPEFSGAPGIETLPPHFRKALYLIDAFEKEKERRRKKKEEAEKESEPCYSRFIPEENFTSGSAFISPEAIEKTDDERGEDEALALESKPGFEQKNGVAPQPGGVPAFPELNQAPDMLKKTLFLKNARAAEPYVGDVKADGLEKLRLEDDGGSGLSFDEEMATLSGTPAASGDYQLRFKGALHNKPVEILAHLAVIPDPKSLWVAKDSDRTDRFWKPDEAFECVNGDFFMVGASKRGRSHAKDGGFRDDDFGVLETSDGWGVIVVADGAGSAKFSRRGSQIAVQSVLSTLPLLLSEKVSARLPRLIAAFLQGSPAAEEQIKSHLYQSLVTSAFDAAGAIEEEAKKLGELPSDFLTTLVLCVVKRMREGWFIAGFSIGDGGAAAFNVENGSLFPLTAPDSGEFAGQTRFLQKAEFTGGFDGMAKRIFFTVSPGITGILAMTDGVSDPIFATDSQFANPARWKEFWEGDLSKNVDFSANCRIIEAKMLNWLDFWSPGNHDDRTLVALLPGRKAKS